MKLPFFFKSLIILLNLTGSLALFASPTSVTPYGSSGVQPVGFTRPGVSYLLTKGIVAGGGAPTVPQGPISWVYFSVNQQCVGGYTAEVVMTVATIGHPNPTITNPDCPFSPQGFITSPLTDTYIYHGTVQSDGAGYKIQYAAYASYICADAHNVSKLDMTGQYLAVAYEIWCTPSQRAASY